MTTKSDARLASILARLDLACSHEEVEEIGRGEMSSWLFHAPLPLIDELLKDAKRNNRLRQCVSAARHYSGLSQDKCDRVNALSRAPFPAARGKKRKHRSA